HRRGHVTGTNAVHANALPSVINGHRLGEQHDTTFRGAVSHSRVAAHYTPTGTVVDNHSAALRDHAWQSLFRHQESTFQVDVDLQIPFFFGAVERRVGIEDASIVEKNVDAAEGAQSLFHGASTFVGIKHVRVDNDRL